MTPTCGLTKTVKCITATSSAECTVTGPATTDGGYDLNQTVTATTTYYGNATITAAPGVNATMPYSTYKLPLFTPITTTFKTPPCLPAHATKGTNGIGN